jgi:adenylate cyclase
MFRLRGRPKDCVVSEETKGRARRRLAAVLVAGLRPLFPGDERGSFARLRFCLTEIIVPLVSQFDGSIFKQTGDLVLSEFGSVVEAVRSAAALREAMVQHNQNLPNEQRIAMSIGINLGDVIAEGDDILGDGVNIAARLEALAEPGSIFVSGTVHHHIADKVEFEF